MSGVHCVGDGDVEDFGKDGTGDGLGYCGHHGRDDGNGLSDGEGGGMSFMWQCRRCC